MQVRGQEALCDALPWERMGIWKIKDDICCAQLPPFLDLHLLFLPALIARFMGPTWGPSGADRTQVGPMLALWTLLSVWPLLVDTLMAVHVEMFVNDMVSVSTVRKMHSYDVVNGGPCLWVSLTSLQFRQNGHHFTDNIFKWNICEWKYMNFD